MQKSAIVPRIVVARVNPEHFIRNFHLTIEVSEAGSPCDFRRPWRPTSDMHADKVGEIGKALINTLLTLHGVDHVTVNSYYVMVKIGQAFMWEDMEPRILAVLLKFFTRPQQVVIQRDKATAKAPESWARAHADAAYRRQVLAPFVAHSGRTDIRV